jgi:flagellar biosynthesis protein FlhA
MFKNLQHSFRGGYMAEQPTAANPAPSSGGEAPAPAQGTAVTETGAQTQGPPAAPGALFDFNDFGDKVMGSLSRGDLGFAMGLMLFLVVLIMPMPSWLLDISLALSIALAVLILMTVVFIAKAMEFNSFPVVLLIATLLRLALNLASTRLILSEGHNGTDAAGEVIEAFGGFIMGDNFIIGIIVFSILTLVNFMVITKGSTRIAEVTALYLGRDARQTNGHRC